MSDRDDGSRLSGTGNGTSSVSRRQALAALSSVGLAAGAGCLGVVEEFTNESVQTTDVPPGDVVELTRTAYDEWLKSRVAQLELVGNQLRRDVPRQDNQPKLSHLLRSELTRIYSGDGLLRNLHYVDFESGEIVASSGSELAGENLYEESFSQSDMERKDGFLLPDRYLSGDNEEVAVVGLRLLLPQNPDGVLLGEIPPEKPDVSPEVNGETTQTGLIHGTDVPILGNPPEMARPEGDADINYREEDDRFVGFAELDFQSGFYATIVVETG